MNRFILFFKSQPLHSEAVKTRLDRQKANVKTDFALRKLSTNQQTKKIALKTLISAKSKCTLVGKTRIMLDEWGNFLASDKEISIY